MMRPDAKVQKVYLYPKPGKRSINPVLVDGVCFQEAKAEAGEQFHGSSAS